MILGIVDEIGYIVNRCVVCRKLFKTDNHLDKVCSYECYNVGSEYLIREDTRFHPKSLTVSCEVCDTLSYVNNRAWHRKTCSDNCSKIHRKAKTSDIVVYKRVCIVCGVSYTTSDVDCNTCSESCAEKILIKTKASYVKICAVCRTLFKTRHLDKHVCSIHCSRQYIDEDRKLEELEELMGVHDVGL